MSKLAESLGKGASMLAFGAMALGAGTPLGLLTFLAGQAPIWRAPRDSEGTPLMEYLYKMTRGLPHISSEQARQEAYYIYKEEDNK